MAVVVLEVVVLNYYVGVATIREVQDLITASCVDIDEGVVLDQRGR